MNVLKFWVQHLQNHILPLCIIFCVSFPLVIFFMRVGRVDLPAWSNFSEVLVFTLLQSLLSLLLSWFLALPAVFGLLAVYQRHRQFYGVCEWVYLLPLLIPPLVIAGGMMNLLESFLGFGLPLIVLGHGLTYSGGIAVILSRMILSKSFSFCEWVQTHGISQRHFFWFC